MTTLTTGAGITQSRAVRHERERRNYWRARPFTSPSLAARVSHRQRCRRCCRYALTLRREDTIAHTKHWVFNRFRRENADRDGADDIDTGIREPVHVCPEHRFDDRHGPGLNWHVPQVD